MRGVLRMDERGSLRVKVMVGFQWTIESFSLGGGGLARSGGKKGGGQANRILHQSRDRNVSGAPGIGTSR